ncbi:hypothetical protein OF83DRAFT_1087406 [Amylostereum chailletii]|nr:hypothetical protein OF83DRAFT_1087406 [Amylostereum chailletii]
MGATHIPSPATGTGTAAKSDSEKTAEFRRLFYFFDKLSQPRPRPGGAAEDAYIPNDLAPLLKRLSSILKKDAPEDLAGADEPSATASLHPSFALPPRPRRSTTVGVGLFAAPAPPTTPSPQPNASPTTTTPQDNFPLAHKRYPFTFKMMLHKLYNLDDWAAKVRDVLAASQEQYRPLEAAPDPASPSSPPGTPVRSRVHSPPTSPTFSAAFAPVPQDAPSSPSPGRSPMRRRAMTVAEPKENKAPSGPGLGAGAALPPRALKKRIVNRRRSVSGPFEKAGEKAGGGWVYDAAVSSVDVDAAARRAAEEPRRKRVMSSVSFQEEEEEEFGERRARKRSFVEV